jgi:hypothetical protein
MATDLGRKHGRCAGLATGGGNRKPHLPAWMRRSPSSVMASPSRVSELGPSILAFRGRRARPRNRIRSGSASGRTFRVGSNLAALQKLIKNMIEGAHSDKRRSTRSWRGDVVPGVGAHHRGYELRRSNSVCICTATQSALTL